MDRPDLTFFVIIYYLLLSTFLIFLDICFTLLIIPLQSSLYNFGIFCILFLSLLFLLPPGVFPRGGGRGFILRPLHPPCPRPGRVYAARPATRPLRTRPMLYGPVSRLVQQ